MRRNASVSPGLLVVTAGHAASVLLASTKNLVEPTFVQIASQENLQI